MKQIKQSILLLLAGGLLAASCTEKKAALSGAGATFPQPFYNVVFKKFSTAKGINVAYGGIGSGGGIRSLQDKTVDFAATDAFLSDGDIAETGSEVLHIPTVMGAVVLSYNLPEIESLKLNPEIISDIYLDKITNWNDAKIKDLNPDLNLPDREITAVYRSDGSGTTQNFADFMSKTNEEWKNVVGASKTLNLSTSSGKTVKIAAKGNPGVAGIIVQTQGAIGYIGSEYALAMNLKSAKIQNAAGNFIEATTESISAAAEIEIPEDTRIYISNSSNPEAYPISCLTWLVVYKNQNYNNRTAEQANALKEMLKYIISDEAQDLASSTHYAPLSAVAREKALEIIEKINF
jgi:phosphate transport system substrate-binding protein